MVSGPDGVFARAPGLGAAFKGLTRVVPLGARRVVERDAALYLK